MGDSIRGRKRPAESVVFAVLIGLVELAAAVAGPQAEKGEPLPKVARNPNGGSVAASPDGGTMKKSTVTPAQIRDAQVQAAAKLVDLKLVVVERGDFVVRSPTMPMPVPIVFKEVWMHGRSAQVRMDFRDDDQKTQPWWTGFKSLGHPVMTARSGFRVGRQRVRGHVARVGLCGLPGAAPGRTASGGHCIPSASLRTLFRVCSCRWWKCEKPWIRPERGAV